MAIEPINQYSPIQSKPTDRTTDSHAKSSEKPPEPEVFLAMGSTTKAEGKGFGPDYVLDDALKPREVVGGVPFASSTSAQTLASLPPIHPLGTEALTELSLQKMMQPRNKAP